MKTFTIEKYNDKFEGVATHNNKKIVISGVIPGETVKVDSKIFHGEEIYDIVEVVNPSKNRISVKCPYYKQCGNCALLHLSYNAQLFEKTELVRKKLNFENVTDCVRGKQFGYRNKLHLVFIEKSNKIGVGFFNDKTHRTVAIKKCLLHGDWFEKVANILTAWAEKAQLTVYDPKTGNGLLRFAIVRYLDNNICVTVVATDKRINGISLLYDELSKTFGKASLYININAEKTSRVFSDKFLFVGGEKQLSGKMCGVEFSLSPDTFFQVNTEVAEKIYATVCEEIQKSDIENVIDCFSGIGITSILFAKMGKKVTSIEIVQRAVADAVRLAKQNNVEDSINAICGDAVKILQECDKTERTVFFVDPPRCGLGKKVCQAIAEFSPKKIVYLSCAIESLNMDINILKKSGYCITMVKPFDLFPQTRHVETLVVLSHKIPDSHIAVKVDFDDKIDDISKENIKSRAEARKPQARTTYKMIQAYVEEHYGFKVHTAYIAEVKRDLGLPMYDCPNAVDIRTHEPQHPTAQMVAAITDALRQYAVI